MDRWGKELDEEEKKKSWKKKMCVSMCVDKMRIKKGHCNAPSVAKKDKKRKGEEEVGERRNKREREREQKRRTCDGAWNVSPALSRSGPN
jgi:hypothetical protein